MVSPQAIEVFLPITTPGTEARLKPVTSNGQVSVTVRQCSPTWAKIDGIEVARWGSLDRIGSPLAVVAPADGPGVGPGLPLRAARAQDGGTVSLILVTPTSTSAASRSWPAPAAAGSGRAELRRAVGSNAFPTTVPRLTIGS